MTTDETAATETLEALAKGREKTASGVDPDNASPGAQFEARRLEEEADYLRMGAAALRVRGMLVAALEGLLREEPNVYEGRLEASLYVTVDALEAARSALAETKKS